jgi:hypothetical protein
MKGSDASRSSSANHAATSVTTGSTSTPRPARRTLTRSPLNLNSRGSRTAWLRPFLNSLAVVLTIPSPLGLYQKYRPYQCSGKYGSAGARKALRTEQASDFEANWRKGWKSRGRGRDARHRATGGTPVEPRNSENWSGRPDSNRRPPAPRCRMMRLPATLCNTDCRKSLIGFGFGRRRASTDNDGISQSTIDMSSSPSRAGLPITSISVILPSAIVNRSALTNRPRGATTTPMAPSTSAGCVSRAMCP